MTGVLAFQGSFAPHLRALERLGAPARPVKTAADLAGCERLILPGGESTVISKWLLETGLGEEIARRVRAGDLALFGTCAGAILLGKEPPETPGEPPQAGARPARLGLADVDVQRNAYGRQIDSFVGTLEGTGPLEGTLEGVFIRAPRFTRLGPAVETLAREGDEPVLVRDGRCLLAAFHPELTDDLRVHRLFVERV
jgi:5'-phosphate synthase pdxT subunit